MYTMLNAVTAFTRQTSSTAAQLQRRALLPHQISAVKKIVDVLSRHDRTQYIAACGSGKTLVGAHVAMALATSSVVVFLPSLALMRQTLAEWSAEHVFDDNYSILCVCSDDSITAGVDSITVTETELGAPITTDNYLVSRFLSASTSKIRIVLCTYQSASVLAKGIPHGFKFDIGVLDEAHKTAGHEEKSFAIPLEDRNVPIRKRLFLTATQRHCQARCSDDEELVTVNSMGSEESYGPVADRVSLSEAIKRGLVCDYRTVISVITSDDINHDLLRYGSCLRVKNNRIDSLRTAHYLALQSAVRQHDVKKIFTFHSTIREAKDFICGGNPGIKEYLPDFQVFHVNGMMSAAERDRVMTQFRLVNKAILSNARCLTEGVDVPATDMVMFASPRDSSIDIIQAIGRALRKHGSKKYGYILLPVFVNLQHGESIEAACARTRHNFAWEVIQTLKEEDGCLESLIDDATIHYSRTGATSPNAFAGRIEIIGSHKDIDQLSRCIATTCIETTGSSFSEWFGLLQAYKDKMGHCRVPESCEFNGKKLGRWVKRIRNAHRNGVLPADKINRLGDVGFVWEPWLADFERKLKLLEAFEKEHGHCMVPANYIFDGADLGYVVGRIRLRRELLSANQVAALDRINFVWSVFDKRFNEWCVLLSSYKNEHGDCLVPQSYIAGDNCRLGKWVSMVRIRRTKGHLSADKIAKLDKIGFEWNAYSTKFDAWIQRLKSFKEEFGSFDVPDNYKTEDGWKLGYWVCSIGKRDRAGLLTHEQICKLEEIGFM